MPMPAPASIDATDTRDTAVVLVNLGTPDAPTPKAVRRYLGEFLMDRRVVPLSRWLWWPLLRLAILPVRSPVVAKKYASIWMHGEDAGSPLAVHTRRLAQAVQRELPQYRVFDAMRYGQPSLANLIDQLRAQGVRRVLALPLYPQYSTSTTASVDDVLARALASHWREYGSPASTNFCGKPWNENNRWSPSPCSARWPAMEAATAPTQPSSR